MSLHTRSIVVASFICTAVGLASMGLVTAALAADVGYNIVSVTSTGMSTTTLLPGDELTIDFTISNPNNLAIAFLEVGSYGYDLDLNNVADDGLEFVGGAASSSILNTTVIPSVGPIGGLNNLTVPPFEVTPNIPGTTIPAGLSVFLFRHVGFTDTTGSGADDYGVDGGLVAPGGTDAHFRAVFRAQTVTSPTEFTLQFGTDPSLSLIGNSGGGTLTWANDTWAVTVVPEPSTALLVGVGLGLLARRARPTGI